MSADTWLLVAVALVILIIGFGFFVLFYRKKRLSSREMEKIRHLWKEIEAAEEAHPEQAILKADKLLDYALTHCGFTGHLGEKLKKAKSLFSDENAVWSAHKLRNQIAHEIHIDLSSGRTRGALQAFKKAFLDLGIRL